MPPPRSVDRRVAGVAMLAAPLAALPLAAAVTTMLLTASALGAPALAAGGLAVLVLALGTRALHWDGLSDVADGLTASYDAERSLAVMRSGASGPAGTLALVLVALLQSAGLAALSGSPAGCATAGLAVLVSRCALAVSCVRGVPSARAEGLGATVAGSVPRPAAVLSWLLAAAATGALLATTGGDPVRGLLVVALAVVAVAAVVRRCVRRLGGVTGDVLGASVEVCLAVLVVGLATA